MIVPKDSLEHYLGRDITELAGKISVTNFEKLRIYHEFTLSSFKLPALDYLFLEHQTHGKSLRDLSKETEISDHLLRKIFDLYGLPRLNKDEAIKRKWKEDSAFRQRNSIASREKWEDPLFREKQAAAARAYQEKQWESQEFRDIMAKATQRTWSDPEFKERMIVGTRKRWEDPHFREKIIAGCRKKWEEVEYRNKQSARAREELAKYREDPEIQQRQQEASRQFLLKLWQDPEFRARRIAASVTQLDRLRNDSEFRKKQSEGKSRYMLEAWNDEERRQKFIEGIKRSWEDPLRKEKAASVLKEKWLDPLYRTKMISLLEDPEFQKRRINGAQTELYQRWRENPSFREKIAEASRRARLDPQNTDKYYLPSIQGFRRDINFYAQSMWEANIARILIYCDREFYTREIFRLNVPQRYTTLFNQRETELSVDFVIKDPRDNIILYEIMAHPLENPLGITKLEMLVEQYPQLNLRVIDERTYKRLEKNFKRKINHHSSLIGWEHSEDNVRNNPEKYQ